MTLTVLPLVRFVKSTALCVTVRDPGLSVGWDVSMACNPTVLYSGITYKYISITPAVAQPVDWLWVGHRGSIPGCGRNAYFRHRVLGPMQMESPGVKEANT
jgi:hypothetical protein